MDYQQISDEYGDIELKFMSYYKYGFSYKGKQGNIEISVYIYSDGYPEDIYKLKLNHTETLRSLSFGYITIKVDGVTIINADYSR